MMTNQLAFMYKAKLVSYETDTISGQDKIAVFTLCKV